MLRYFLPLILVLICSQASAVTSKTCAAKEQEIQQQIDYAKQYNNSDQTQGLEIALRELRSNCTDEELQREKQRKISEKQNKVTERQQELYAAQKTGDTDKIAKKQQKLAEAQSELTAAQTE